MLPIGDESPATPARPVLFTTPGAANFRRLCRTIAVSLTALLLVTCTDSPVGPGRGGIGYVRLQPVFPAHSQAVSLTLDKVRVVVIRLPADTLADVSKQVPLNATQVRLDIPVRLQQNSENLEVHLELYAGTTLLFSGMSTVTVVTGTGNPVAPIPLTYKGPGANLAAVTLGPRDSTVASGAIFSFTASAVDSQAAPVAQFYLSWSATAGTINAAGTFTAPVVADTVWVRAVTPTGIWDSTQVFVTGMPTQVTIASPNPQQGIAGGRLPQPLAVLVRDANSQPVPGVVAAFSVLTGGGSVDSATATTDAQGIARSGVTLGATPGQQTFRATVGNLLPVTFTATATTLPTPQPVLLAAGDQFSCGIGPGGVAYCWGLNSSGQLGDGTTTRRLVPTPVTGSLTFTSISAGYGHACGVATGGTVYCWGANGSGQLGDGTTTPHPTPTPVSGGGSYTAVHAGAGFTCAVTTSGAAYCWGNNGSGNLGDGSNSQRLVPTPVAGGLTFLQLSLFTDNHTCGLTTGGDAYCWGYNFDGAVGDGTLGTGTNRNVPTLVLGGRTYQAVASGHYHSCALDAGGAAWCWGDNNVQQLGDGTAPNDKPAPVQVQGGHTFTALRAGGVHTCGLTAGGQVYCWGMNASGQLGDGSTNWSQVPVLVSGGGSFTAMAGGESHTCALVAGTPNCWGDNAQGELGDGTTTTRLTPVTALAPPASVAVQAGNNLTVTPGTDVLPPPAVLVRDAQSNPLLGVEVVFAVTGGGGSLTSATALTDAFGVAAVGSWTLGATPGVNTLTATVSAGGVTGNPVTFTATGTTGPVPLQWNGGTNNWNTAANWTPAQVPTSSDDVVIPAGTPNTPTVTTSCAAKSLTVNTGATLDVGSIGCQVQGDVLADGAITGTGAVVMLATGQVRGNLSTLTVSGPVTVNAGTALINLTDSGASGSLTLNGQTVSLSNNLVVQTGALLVMTNATDLLSVGGNATFDGANELGQLSAGTLVINGNLTQLATTSPDAFHTSGTHLTVFTGASPTLTFATPGNVPGSSHFEQFRWTVGGTMTLATDVFAHGTMDGSPGVSGTIASINHKLQVGNFVSGGATFDGTALVLDQPAGAPIALANVTFTNMSSTANQLTVNHPGTGSPFVFDNLTFSTAPSTGFYLLATDLLPSDGVPLTINVTNSSPASGAPYVSALNTAVVNWPAASPALTWNGSVSTDWNTAGNWSPAAVPTGTNDVTIPAGPPGPVISTNADANSLTVSSGATLTVNNALLKLGGNLAAIGLVSVTGSSGLIELVGSGKTVMGAVGRLEVHDTASYTAIGGILVTDTLTLRGRLTVAGQTITISGDLRVFASNGLLVMQNPADYVFVGGNAGFSGLASAGFLTDGVLEVVGKFSEAPVGSTSSFSASGNHTTKLSGTTFQQVDFQSAGGIGPSNNHFANLDVSSHTSGGVDFFRSNTVVVEGQLIVLPGTGLVQFFTSGGGQLSVGGVNVHDLVLNGLPLTINGGNITQFDRVSFSFAGTADGAKTQLTVNHPGAATPFFFDALTFQDVPTTGRYLLANDTDGGTPNVLAVNLTNPSPSAPSGFIQANNGALINWPPVTPLIWIGGVDANWFNGNNWSSAGGPRVPTATDDVVIPAGTVNAPVLSASAAARDLTIQAGAVVDLNSWDINLSGSLAANATPSFLPGAGGRVQLQGTGRTVTGDVGSAELGVYGSYSLSGATAAGDLFISGTGTLTVNGYPLTVATVFTYGPGVRLIMTNPADLVTVAGTATFDGGATSGSLTAGVLRVGGNILVTTNWTQTAFQPTLAHRVVLTNTASSQSVNFGTVNANFQDLELVPSGAMSMPNNVRVDGQLITTGGAAQAPAVNGLPVPGGGGILSTLTVAGVDVDGLLVNQAPLLIGNGTITRFQNVSFSGQASTATQLTVDNPGTVAPYVFDQITFNTVPTGGGLYLSANDNNISDGVPLVVDLTNPTPATDGGFSQALNGATINWPAASPVITWTGTAGTDWNNPGNWTGGVAPTASDNVVIPNGVLPSPVINNSTAVHDLTIQAGATLGLGDISLDIFGNLDASGSIVGCCSDFIGLHGGTVRGNFDNVFLNVSAGAVVTLNGATTLTNSSVQIAGELILGGNTLDLGQGTLSTVNGTGLLTMTDPNDLVLTGTAEFSGNDETGRLTFGGIRTRLFAQGSSGLQHPASFFASGNHWVSIEGPSASSVTFFNPTTSRFQDLDVTLVNGSLSLGSDITVAGQLISVPLSGSGPTILKSVPSALLTTGGADIVATAGFTALTMDGVPLVLGGQQIASFSDISFQNQNPLGTQLTVNDPGTTAPYVFSNLSFGVVPSTGLYMSATDVNTSDGNPLTIDVVGASPASGAPYFTATPPAVINWPATGSVFTWDGSADQNWFNPANWDLNAVPGVIDDVILVPITNQPLMTSSTGINNLTIQAGAILDVDTTVLVIGGTLDNAGVINGVAGTGGMGLTGTGKTMNGTVNVDVFIPGSYALNGGFSALSVAVAGASGSLDLNLYQLTTTADFSTLNSGTLTMTDPGGQLAVGGSVMFAGGDETGKLTAGFLLVGGDFSQFNFTSPGSFVASGTHSTNLNNLNPVVTFTDPTASHFQDMSWGGIGGTLTMGSDVTVLGTYNSPDGLATMAGNGHSFTSGSFFSGGLNVDNMPIVIDQPVAGFINLFGITFTNMPTTATQITLRYPGQVGGVSFSGIFFSPLTTGDTGFYIDATDTDIAGSNPDILTINVDHEPDPAGGPTRGAAHQNTAGGAVVNWFP